MTAPGVLPEPVAIGPRDGGLTVRLLDRIGPGGEERVAMHFGGDVMLGRRYEEPTRPGTPVVHDSASARRVVDDLGPVRRSPMRRSSTSRPSSVSSPTSRRIRASASSSSRRPVGSRHARRARCRPRHARQQPRLRLEGCGGRVDARGARRGRHAVVGSGLTTDESQRGIWSKRRGHAVGCRFDDDRQR